MTGSAFPDAGHSCGPLQVVWFKRDLRIHDHAPLVEAARRGPVLPLYMAETGYWAGVDVSARQWLVIHDGLVELDEALAGLGQRLIVRQGDAVDLLARLHGQHGIAHLWSHEETGNAWTYVRDRAVMAFCRKNGIGWTQFPQFGVIRPLTDRDRWAQAVRSFMQHSPVPPPRALVPVPAIPAGTIPSHCALGLADDPCPERQPGGRKAGLSLLDSFLAGRGRGYRAAMSSPVTAADRCSRLSVHLATGTLSVREILHRAWAERALLGRMQREIRPVDLGSVDALIARLHWHCHFIQKLESEPELEWRAQHRLHEANRRTTAPDDPLLCAWAMGLTGFPFLDACMRALADTGWLNFRMRAMVQSFASYHLGLDWQSTGVVLARRFADYEPGIHWPQVQMQSGQTGINTPRIYNPVKQGIDQDPEGLFTRRWVPELRDVPPAYLQEPWRMDSDMQAACRCRIGIDYPARIIDHVAAARSARDRLADIRAQAGYGAEAQRVYKQHGSRKRHPSDARALAGRDHAVLPKLTKKQDRQMGFDFGPET